MTDGHGVGFEVERLDRRRRRTVAERDVRLVVVKARLEPVAGHPQRIAKTRIVAEEHT